MDDFLIVVGWDASLESEAAVEAAGEFAERANGRVRVVYAWDFLSQPGEFDPHFSSDDASQLVLEAAVRLLPVDVPFSAVAQLGLAHEVLDEQTSDADVIVVGRSGLGKSFARFMGSTATHVVRHARVPVLVVPNDHVALASSAE
jgi:nucleotide-binding universal stress UspA family protein